MRFVLLLFILSFFDSLSQSAQRPIFGIKSNPIICGHRGGFYENMPENSMEVIQFVTGNMKRLPVLLEVDVRRSKDGTLYILHDESVDRTTSGSGKISMLTDDYINSLYLKKNSTDISDQRIMFLAELLDSLKNRPVLLMLDIKENAWIETAELILQKGWVNRSVFLTFNYADTEKLYNYSQQLIISVLMRNDSDWDQLKKRSLSSDRLIAYILRDATSDWSDRLRQSGFTIMADVSEHTTNGGLLYKEEYYKERVKKNKLDILITDFPIEVASFLHQ